MRVSFHMYIHLSSCTCTEQILCLILCFVTDVGILGERYGNGQEKVGSCW